MAHSIDRTIAQKAAADRFINLRTKKKVKEFIVKQRGYKRPDFNRMILDLNKCGWTHEKIAFVLPVADASVQYLNGRVVVFQIMKMERHL